MASCIVTGAAGGNGLAIARVLMRSGYRVIGVDRVPIPDNGASVCVLGDVLDDAVMAEAFAHAMEAENANVCLVNNAGITIPEMPQSDAAWSRTLEVNLSAPFRWSREYASRVTTGHIREGSIVFIGSLATTMGFPNNPAYHATKCGVLGLARSFAVDLGRFGIRANCVSPGYIRTAMSATSYEDPTRHEARRRHTLLQRWGNPEDVAEAVSFLCGPASAYITGINLPVDGGWLVCGLVE